MVEGLENGTDTQLLGMTDFLKGIDAAQPH